MADMEKVVDLLNDCLDASRRDNTWVFVRKDIVEDVIPLLKEQEAQNVVDMVLSKKWFRTASCPKCNELLEWVYHRNYCGYCGQAVKWE
jgi:hypothetical protein